MTLEEVEARIKQISDLLYKDNPERQQKGLFSDSPKGVRDTYELKLDAMEDELDALYKLKYQMQDASPEVGEKLVADFLNLYPMGKRGSAGIGSLLGKEIGEMSEAEALRIKDIEQKIYELNSVYQKEGRGLKEIEALEGEKQGIMSMLSKIPLSPETQARNLSDLLETDASGRKVLNENFARRNPGVALPIRGTATFYPTTNTEALKKLSPTDSEAVLNIFKAEKRSIKMMPEVQMYGGKEKAEVFRDIDKEFEEIFNVLKSNIKSYKAGGYVMNYGDYGRSYT